MTDANQLSSHDVIAGLWRLSGWGVSVGELGDWIRGVLELGIDTFDLADVYGDYACEELFGAALRAEPGLRDELRLVTKCDIKLVSERRPEHRRHVYDTSREHIVASAENSLRALGTDRLDLLLLHRQDPLMDPRQVAAAFEQLLAAGKVLAFGVSNFTPSHVSMLSSYLTMPLVTNQVEASVLHHAPFLDGTFDQCLERRMRPMAWSPLAGGRPWTDDSEPARRVRATLTDIAELHGVSTTTVAMAFLLRHPAGIHPITGSSRLERIGEAARARDLELSREEWFELWCACTGEPLP